jgi:predicted nucleic acid-binding protein
MKVFIDTVAFIAITDADNEYHQAAAAFYRHFEQIDGIRRVP